MLPLEKKDNVVMMVFNKLVPKHAKNLLKDNTAYVIAATAGEYYGHNANLDYFPEKELIGDEKNYGYITYIGKPFIKYHQKGKAESIIGEVIWAHYNDLIHAVGVIVEIFDDKVLDLLHQEKILSVSMSCIPEYDVCSICGNKARTRLEYCQHIKNALADVKNRLNSEAYLINYKIKYAELSLVAIPADPLAMMFKQAAYDPMLEISYTPGGENLLEDFKKIANLPTDKLIELILQYQRNLRTVSPVLYQVLKVFIQFKDRDALIHLLWKLYQAKRKQGGDQNVQER